MRAMDTDSVAIARARTAWALDQVRVVQLNLFESEFGEASP